MMVRIYKEKTTVPSTLEELLAYKTAVQAEIAVQEAAFAGKIETLIAPLRQDSLPEFDTGFSWVDSFFKNIIKGVRWYRFFLNLFSER